MSRSTALLILTVAFACDPSTTAPDGAGSDGPQPSFKQGPSDQPCVGQLGPGTFHNVFVPPGAACNLSNSTLTGNLTALEGSTLHAADNVIHGNVEGDKADIVQIGLGVVRGDIVLRESTFDPGPGECCDAVFVNNLVVEGDIQIQKNVVNTIVVGLVTVNKGKIRIEDNTTSFALEVTRNTVAKNLRVFKNQGIGEKTVTGNTVGQNLQCFQNDPPFVGGPNTAKQAHGQCFVGVP